jgi:hypothetical protein
MPFFVIFIKFLGAKLPYSDIGGVRERLQQISPTFARYDNVEQANFFKENVTITQV